MPGKNLKHKRLDDPHYLPTLDGWRAIAIFIVILSHDQVWHVGRRSDGWFAANGRVGVDIFFALSGLLICTRLLREEALTGSIHLRGFYIRRFFRIQPAAWLYLLTISTLMLTGVLDRAFAGVAYATLLVRNFLPLAFPAREWYTAHFWSLAVEEHFYFLLPGFLLMFRRRRATLLFGLAALLEVWLRMQWKFPRLTYGWAPEDHTENAILGIVLACAFAVLLRRPVIRGWCMRWLNPYAAFGVAICLILLRGHMNPLLGDLLFLCLCPLVLISTTLHPETLPSRLLESSLLRAVGTISYSLYLWQMLFFTHSAVMPVSHSRVLFTIQHTGLLRYVALFACSIASYYLVEKPLLQIGRRLASRSRAPRHPARRVHDTAVV